MRSKKPRWCSYILPRRFWAHAVVAKLFVTGKPASPWQAWREKTGEQEAGTGHLSPVLHGHKTRG